MVWFSGKFNIFIAVIYVTCVVVFQNRSAFFFDNKWRFFKFNIRYSTSVYKVRDFCRLRRFPITEHFFGTYLSDHGGSLTTVKKALEKL